VQRLIDHWEKDRGAVSNMTIQTPAIAGKKELSESGRMQLNYLNKFGFHTFIPLDKLSQYVLFLRDVTSNTRRSHTSSRFIVSFVRLDKQ
jgi:hypothetical protein